MMNEADAIAAEVLKCLNEPLVGEPILEIVESKCAENEKYGPLIMCIEDHKRPPTKMVLLCDLVKGGHEYVHEVFGSFNEWLRPYGDFEMYFDTEAEMEAKKWPLWELCLKNIRRRVGDLATIRGFEACGYKADKKRWVVSFHYTIQGVGAFECGMDIMRAGYVPNEEGFDQSPYREPGARQTMRMPGMSKTGENRPFKFIGGVEGQWVSIDIWKLPEHQRRAILTVGLAQMICDEKRRDVPRSGEMLIGDEVVALGTNGLPLGEDIKITAVAQVERLAEIAGWMGEVNRDYDTYCEEIWTLRNTADQYKLDIEEMRALAQKVAAVCPNNNPDHVNSLFNASGGRSTCQRRRLIAHLRKAAKEKNAEAYAEWIKPLREAQKIDDLKEFIDRVNALDFSRPMLAKHETKIRAQGAIWCENMLRAKMTKQSITNMSFRRMEWLKSKGCPFPRPFFISDQKWFHDQMFDSYDLINQFIDSTLNKAICGGEAIWITHEFKQSTAEIESRKLKACPLKDDDATMYSLVNRDWDVELMKAGNGSTEEMFLDAIMNIMKAGSRGQTSFPIRDIALDRRKTKFSQNVGYLPYLKQSQKVDEFELFNLFDGFRWIHNDAAHSTVLGQYPPELKPFMYHIYEILAAGDPKLGDYLCAWLSFLLREPNRKPETALFIRSKLTRAGKNVFFREFSRWVMGWSHYLYIQDIQQLTCGFNTHRECKRLVVIGETEGRAGYENCEIMKTIITDSECLWTSKGIDSRHGHDSSAIVILSNNRNVVKIDPGDARYCAFDMSCAKVGDKKYFVELVKCFEQHGRLFFDWLTHLETDIEVSLPPNTNFKKALTMENLAGPIKFIREVCEHKLDHIGLPESGGVLDCDEKDDELRVKTKELYNAYRQWEIDDQGTNQRFVPKLSTFIDELEKLNIPNKKMKSNHIRALDSGSMTNSWNTMAFAIKYSCVLDGYRKLIGDPDYEF